MKATKRRKQIRERLAEQLESLKTDYPGLEVFSERQAVIPEEVSQYVQVWFAKGSPEIASDESRRDDSDLVVQVFIQAAGGVDDALDERGDKIESLIDADYTLGGLVDDCEQVEWRYGKGDQAGWFWLGYGYKLQFETELD